MHHNAQGMSWANQVSLHECQLGLQPLLWAMGCVHKLGRALQLGGLARPVYSLWYAGGIA